MKFGNFQSDSQFFWVKNQWQLVPRGLIYGYKKSCSFYSAKNPHIHKHSELLGNKFTHTHTQTPRMMT